VRTPGPGPQGAALSLALAPDEVARALTGTPVFTVCNSSNEFVLVSDPATGLRSLGLLCFRSEDADALLSHVFRWLSRRLLAFVVLLRISSLMVWGLGCGLGEDAAAGAWEGGKSGAYYT